MPTSKEAVEWFLKQRGDVLEYKGRPLEWLERDILRTTGVEYEPITPPRHHQMEGLAFALNRKRAMLFFDMRTGKTLISLDWARHLQRAGMWWGKGLVIAHSPLGLDVWREQAEQHSSLKVACVRSKPEEMITALQSDADLIVVPWTGIQYIFSDKKLSQRGKGPPKLYPDRETIRIASDIFSLVVIDEIHLVKNPHSLRFQIASELVSKCDFRLGLTGTPVGRDPFALWGQTFLIDGGETLGRSYPFFQTAFGVVKSNWYTRTKTEIVFNKKLMPVLQAKLNSIALSYKLSEIRDVNVIPNIVSLTMRGEQAKAYNAEVERAREQREDDTIAVKNTFVRLRQISSGFLPFEDDEGDKRIVVFKDSPKMEWLSEIIEFLDDYQYVIFHEFTKSGELITQKLKEYNRTYAWLYGGTIDRGRELKKFTSGQAQVLVANTATGGVGVDLSNAAYMVFFESPVSPIVRKQAEARPLAEARGEAPLIIDDLIVSPVERHILDFIKEGKNLVDSLMRTPKSMLARFGITKAQKAKVRAAR